ncbi:alpha/beta hydrolase [Arthrobacter sp. FW305-BF8]|uniref:alpha/beta hydrolase fold domain-containing protein n=1 Tax=Arthrobacter sp. FW305-BF8 TaxID=2879617 RepID=UPI001F1902A0|nr:alpha/beta hydrolase fold domain-containing protein [Arthrobacter sp. FW305-BF8]UKA54000.1 alpha/beta hydrolase [Arthrobacter sp. FW305-BF8]
MTEAGTALDPELAGLLHHLAGVESVPALLTEPGGPERLDAFCGGLLPYSPPDVPVHDLEVPGPNGPVPVRIYGAGTGGGSPDGGSPALVWMHGGNFAVGSLDMRESDQLGREVAARSGGVVVCVGYRLALDGVHFPVPHEDVLAAWFWTRKHARELGVDPSRICLGGASVGGNLAVGAALFLMDAGLQLPAKLVLAYPFLHGELPAGLPSIRPASQEREAPAMDELPPSLRFTDEDCRDMVENYIGGPLAMASSYAMPGHADPAGLPPAAVLACGHDDLRFSAEAFVEGLRAAGIPVDYRVERGATHGYLNHSAALGVVQRGLQFLADQLAHRGL